MIRELRKYPPVKFGVIAVADSESSAFAQQLRALLTEAGWEAQNPGVGQFVPTGDRPVGVLIMVNSQATAPIGAAVLQANLAKICLSPGIPDSSLPNDTVRLIVGYRK